MFDPHSGWTIIPILAVATIAYLLLAGCAGTGTPSMYLSHDCRGREITVQYREFLSPIPTIDCAILAAERGSHPLALALFMIQLPIACAYATPRGSFVVLPLIGGDLLRDHELQHLVGKRDFIPFLPFPPEC